LLPKPQNPIKLILKLLKIVLYDDKLIVVAITATNLLK